MTYPTSTGSSACPTPRIGSITTSTSASLNCSLTFSPPPWQPRRVESAVLGCPRGEDPQGVVGGGAGLSREDHKALSGTVGAVPGVAVESEVTDGRVMVVLGSVTCAVDVVLGPPGAEVGVLDGEVSDKLR